MIHFIKTVIMLRQTVFRDHCKSSVSYKAGNVLSVEYSFISLLSIKIATLWPAFSFSVVTISASL